MLVEEKKHISPSFTFAYLTVEHSENNYFQNEKIKRFLSIVLLF